MTNSEPQQHHHSQWTQNPIKIRICLSKNSLKPRDRFFSLISVKGGYTIPHPCFFTNTSRDNNSFRIQINVMKKSPTFSGNEKPLSFHAISTMGNISHTCSKLNMANALDCNIIANLEDTVVSFTITAPDQATEEILLKNFSLFDGSRVSN